MRWSINKRSDGFFFDYWWRNEMKWNEMIEIKGFYFLFFKAFAYQNIVKLFSSPRFGIFSFIFGAFYVPWLTHKSTRETKGNKRETREMFLSQSFISSPLEERRMKKERKVLIQKILESFLSSSSYFSFLFFSRAQSLHAHTSSTLISFLLDSAFNSSRTMRQSL